MPQTRWSGVWCQSLDRDRGILQVLYSSFPNFLSMGVILTTNIALVKTARESFLGREVGFFELIPTRHILIRINSFPFE